MHRFITTLCTVVLLLTYTLCVFAQVTWQKHPSPVLPVWGGDINDPSIYKYTYAPFVLYDNESNLYRMWYSYQPFGFGVQWCIGYALSTDGINWFGYFKNPVFRPGNPGMFDGNALFTPFVIKVDNEFRMYYCGYSGSSWQIGVATSFDGIQWTKYTGNPILTVRPGTWEAMAVNDPKVFHNGNQFIMFYSGHMSLSQAEIGMATSPDGFVWERNSQNPVLTRGPSGSWDQYSVRATAAFVGNGKYYLLYDGGAFKPVGFASSVDGNVWTKYPGNPVFSTGNTWDAIRVEYGSIVREGSQLMFWYSGYGFNSAVGDDAWQIGYATSDFVTAAEEISHIVPDKYRLSDASPSPFNPETEITYAISGTDHVQIKVFDTLGKEVATLVDELKKPGSYVVRWKPASNASGVYFYRMNAGPFSDSKKLILLK